MKRLRTVLFVPGNQTRLLDKARGLPADAVMLDLEDGVPPGAKLEARAHLRHALETGGYGPQVVVRVNGFATGLTEGDLQATLLPGVAAVCLPKPETMAEVAQLDERLSAQERERDWPVGELAILLMIETAQGVLCAHDLARASPRVRALCLGGEDLARELGAVRSREGQELAHARAHMVLAARATGALAIDTIWTDLNDPEGLLQEARQARGMGYSGKLVIHPAQVEPVHRAFAPTVAEIELARRTVAAFEAAEARGEGVVALEGQMIDAPVVARARELLAAACDEPHTSP